MELFIYLQIVTALRPPKFEIAKFFVSGISALLSMPCSGGQGSIFINIDQRYLLNSALLDLLAQLSSSL